MTEFLPSLFLEDINMEYKNSGFTLGPINLHLASGHLLGVLGQNGAGKSTLFQIISGNQRPSSGQVLVDKYPMHIDAFDLKRKIGYLPQHLELPRWVTAHELLGYAIRLHQLEPLEDLRNQALEYWDCKGFAHKPLATCSHGMQKRVGLALCMLHKPSIAILDEPFSGLDLFHIRALTQLLETRKKSGLITILSTHIAPYAAKLCDSVLLIEKGQPTTMQGWQQQGLLERIDAIENFFFMDNKTI